MYSIVIQQLMIWSTLTLGANIQIFKRLYSYHPLRLVELRLYVDLINLILGVGRRIHQAKAQLHGLKPKTERTDFYPSFCHKSTHSIPSTSAEWAVAMRSQHPNHENLQLPKSPTCCTLPITTPLVPRPWEHPRVEINVALHHRPEARFGSPESSGFWSPRTWEVPLMKIRLIPGGGRVMLTKHWYR